MASEYLLQTDNASKVTLADNTGFLLLASSDGGGGGGGTVTRRVTFAWNRSYTPPA